jgi:NADH-quinone oxidoreductase subunit L
MSQWLLFATIIPPWLGAVGVLLIGDRHPKAQGSVAALFALCSAVASLLLWPLATATAVIQIPLGGMFGDLSFVPDGLGICLATIATCIGSLTIIFSIAYMHGQAQLGRYYAFVLVFIGSMAGLVLTSNLMLLFIFWEITAVCSFALIAFDNDNPRAVAGGLKALIVTQIGGLGLLVRSLIAYTNLGNYEIATVLGSSSRLSPSILTAFAFCFMPPRWSMPESICSLASTPPSPLCRAGAQA